MAIITFCAVWAALATLRVIRQQTAENRRAIEAARHSAAAAAISAHAFVNSERAWVVVNDQRAPKLMDSQSFFGKFLTIEIINRGRTPARFTGTIRANSKFATLKDLPEIPDFPPPRPDSPADSELMLSPNETRDVVIPISLPSEHWEAASKAEASEGRRLFVYASFLYYAFGELRGELGVCYAYIPDPNQPPFIRHGPQGYNKQT